jgi:hypothetical protein
MEKQTNMARQLIYFAIFHGLIWTIIGMIIGFFLGKNTR